MIIKAPKPETFIIPGEKETELVVDLRPTRHALRDFYANGYFRRAIVTYAHDPLGKRYDPFTWGIVCEFHGQRAFPLEVHWADGTVKYHNMEDLYLIYSGVTETRLKELHNARDAKKIQ